MTLDIQTPTKKKQIWPQGPRTSGYNPKTEPNNTPESQRNQDKAKCCPKNIRCCGKDKISSKSLLKRSHKDIRPSGWRDNVAV